MPIEPGGVHSVTGASPRPNETELEQKLSGLVFGRQVSVPENDTKPRLFRGSSLRKRPDKGIKHRRNAIRRARPQVNRKQRLAHLHKQALKRNVANLNPKNQVQVDAWVMGMKQGLAKVADDLKKAGVKDVTMDIKLDKLFEGYQFSDQDYGLLYQLKQLKGGGNLVAHLSGKICKEIVESRGFDSNSVADRLARRNDDCRESAVVARQRLLMDAPPEDLNALAESDVMEIWWALLLI